MEIFDRKSGGEAHSGGRIGSCLAGQPAWGEAAIRGTTCGARLAVGWERIGRARFNEGCVGWRSVARPPRPISARRPSSRRLPLYNPASLRPDLLTHHRAHTLSAPASKTAQTHHRSPSLPAQQYVDRRGCHRDPRAHHGGARRRHRRGDPGGDRRRRPQARQGDQGGQGQEARRAEEAARHPLPPDLRRDGLRGDQHAEGEDGVEPGGDRQVHRGQALGAPPGQLPQDPAGAAQEARRLRQAYQGQELLQAGLQGPRRRQAQGQGARQEEARRQGQGTREEARRQAQGPSEEAGRRQAQGQGPRQEGSRQAQGQGSSQDQGRHEAQGQGGPRQAQGEGCPKAGRQDEGRRQAQGPPSQVGQDLRQGRAREEGARRCPRQEARRQEAPHQADDAGEEGTRRRQEGARPEGRQEVGTPRASC